MEFTNFLNIVPHIKSEPLIASEAHLKMAPIERVQYYKKFDFSKINPKKSAVVTLFFPENDTTKLLLIVRSAYPGIHSSQIAFPGGKMDPEDIDLLHTALRELYEEVGVRAQDLQIVKKWSELYIPPSNFMVTPYMAFATHEPKWNLQPDEVADIIKLDIDLLCHDAFMQEVEMSTSYAQNIKVPAFVIDHHIIWGATAMILSEIKQTLLNIQKIQPQLFTFAD